MPTNVPADAPTDVSAGAPTNAPTEPIADVPAAAPAPVPPAAVAPQPHALGVEAPPARTDEDADEAGYPRWEPTVRLMTGAELKRTHPTAEQNEADSRQPFFLQQARVKLGVEWNKHIQLSVSGDLDDKPMVRSAFAHFRFKRAAQLRVGRFKRPFSRIELTSVGDLPFRERGLFNQQLIERAGWGDRSLGVMFRGKLKHPRLRYSLAVMNSAPSVDVARFEQLRGADVLGRVEYAPIKALTFALNGGHKVVEARIDGPDLHLNAVGGDVRWKADGLIVVAEALAAQNPTPPTPPADADRTPWAINVIGYAAYAIDLGGGFDLQPTLLGDFVDTDMDVSEDETLRLSAGLNLRWDKRVRVMPQVAIIQPLGTVGARSQLATEHYQVVLSVQL